MPLPDLDAAREADRFERLRGLDPAVAPVLPTAVGFVILALPETDVGNPLLDFVTAAHFIVDLAVDHERR